MAGDLFISTINGGPISGMRNAIINGAFNINQRVYTSGAATTAGQYTLDRWKVTTTAGISFAAAANKTTVTIPAGQTLQQVIEGLNLHSGIYTLSWEGTAQGRVGAGAFGNSGLTAAVTGGVNTTIEFGPGTVSRVQFEFTNTFTAFEPRLIAQELALCQRYFCKTYPLAVSPGAAGAAATSLFMAAEASSNYLTVPWSFPTAMRAVPTITAYSPSTGATGVADRDGVSIAIAAGRVSDVHVALVVQNVATTVNQFVSVHATASSEI